MPGAERWPPVYDAGDLKSAIARLSEGFVAGSRVGFFQSEDLGPAVCQGDVLEFGSPIPVIDESGNIVIDEESDRGLVIGNTCDFERPVETAAWTQVVPLLPLGHLVPERQRDQLNYRLSRRFYVPPWTGCVEPVGFVADLLRPVAMHKTAALTVGTVRARLSFEGWMLLHACLARFLCRDDGRFDE